MAVSYTHLDVYKRQDEEKFKSAFASRKTFRGPKTGKFNDLDRFVYGEIHEKWNQGYLICWEVIRIKALQVDMSLKLQYLTLRQT